MLSSSLLKQSWPLEYSQQITSLSFQGRTADFPPSKLKSGYGEHVCYVLDCLAEEALKYIGFTWKR